MIEGFHWCHNVYFTRLTDGSVQIRIWPPEATVTEVESSPPMLDYAIAPNEWASIVASMCALGENHTTWAIALAAQKG